MAYPTSTVTEYWDRYASGVNAESDLEAAFGWTQWDGRGPGCELLGDPGSALELGCGRRVEVAALARAGIKAEGVDVSPVQVEQSRERWRPLGASFHQGDVIAFLEAAEQRWDAIYSVWGAVWFSDPRVLLPLVRERLAPGGRLVFSHAEPVPGSSGPQGMYGGGFRGRRVWLHQWAATPEEWEELLQAAGFVGPRVWVEPAPQPDHVGTLIGVAHQG
ncbi:class I SAM-dependent methyltransferase [Nocardiopsis exhalans]|uniref:SAM-dependent methyltransferase n=2 Tax=Nocardiopsis TaxID=2013 RepID=A0A840W5X7_9ACTN|nr:MULTISPECIES: class I SAM-dependent methyltransferase [Nocardiopsis]MBB5491462.1 SAM-dependent methyltransferase [Nocardiopsis metallicus]USY18011.1 class I SAM-dependent methyltransferase [Nocardiopsis exhalans]